MAKYEILDVVSDYGIYEDGELKLILNSRTNAEYIKAILEHEERHPNAGVPYSPEVAGMSDEECLAVFRLCDGKRFQCKSCPLYAFDGFDKCSELERRVLAIVDRVVSAADVGPKSEYDELKAMLDAAVAGQETLQKALAEAKSEVARRIFEEMEQSTFGDSTANLIIMPTKDFTKLKKKFCVAEQDSDSRQTVENEKKYMEGKTDENISD